MRNGDKDATSPHEKWHGTAPGDVTKTHLPFGARCSAWQPKQQRDGKLGARARLGVVLGYDDSAQAPIVRVTTKTGKKALRVTAQWRLDPRLPPGVYEAGPLLPDLKGEGEEEQSNPGGELTEAQRSTRSGPSWPRTASLPDMAAGSCTQTPDWAPAPEPCRRTPVPHGCRRHGFFLGGFF